MMCGSRGRDLAHRNQTQILAPVGASHLRALRSAHLGAKACSGSGAKVRCSSRGHPIPSIAPLRCIKRTLQFDGLELILHLELSVDNAARTSQLALQPAPHSSRDKLAPRAPTSHLALSPRTSQLAPSSSYTSPETAMWNPRSEMECGSLGPGLAKRSTPRP
jgi:hypothetical protein